MSPSGIKRAIGRVAEIAQPLLNIFCRKQGNEFAFAISKTGRLQPWLKDKEGAIVPNMDYLSERFNVDKYRGSMTPVKSSIEE